MPNLSASIIRTVVPLIVGALVTLVAHAGLNIDTVHATELVTVVITAVYYIVVRLLEQHISPQFGWLLGSAKTPVYTDASTDDSTADADVDNPPAVAPPSSL
jgi:hypothetical protein